MEIWGGLAVPGNLEVWVTWWGTACLVGVPSAVLALPGDSNGHCHMVPSECPQSTCRHPSAGLTGSSAGAPLPFANPESASPAGCTHSPMRLFSSFTSSCLRISLIRGHTWATREKGQAGGWEKRAREPAVGSFTGFPQGIVAARLPCIERQRDAMCSTFMSALILMLTL